MFVFVFTEGSAVNGEGLAEHDNDKNMTVKALLQKIKQSVF